MRTTLKLSLIALALGGAALTAGRPATAAESVTVTTTTTSPAFGYNDGYWDRAHTWHTWQNEQESTTWRTTNKEHYYECKHDRDPDQGWHEKETYWTTTR